MAKDKHIETSTEKSTDFETPIRKIFIRSGAGIVAQIINTENIISVTAIKDISQPVPKPKKEG